MLGHYDQGLVIRRQLKGAASHFHEAMSNTTKQGAELHSLHPILRLSVPAFSTRPCSSSEDLVGIT